MKKKFFCSKPLLLVFHVFENTLTKCRTYCWWHNGGWPLFLLPTWLSGPCRTLYMYLTYPGRRGMRRLWKSQTMDRFEQMQLSTVKASVVKTTWCSPYVLINQPLSELEWPLKMKMDASQVGFGVNITWTGIMDIPWMLPIWCSVWKDTLIKGWVPDLEEGRQSRLQSWERLLVFPDKHRDCLSFRRKWFAVF